MRRRLVLRHGRQAVTAAPLDRAAQVCATCEGRGLIGGWAGGAASVDGGGGYESEPCPDCSPLDRAAITEAAPTGWRLVPVEPCIDMVAAFWRVKNGHHYHDEPPPTDTSDYAAYRAMIAAAPPPPERDGVDSGEVGR